MNSKSRYQLGTIGKVNTWQPWILLQEALWIDQQGRVITVESISGRYALNILKFVWRLHFKDIPQTDTGSLLMVALRKIVKNELGLYDVEITQLITHQPFAETIRSKTYEWDDIINDYGQEDFYGPS